MVVTVYKIKVSPFAQLYLSLILAETVRKEAMKSAVILGSASALGLKNMNGACKDLERE